MITKTQTIHATFVALALMLLSTTTLAANYGGLRGVPTILDKLVATDGAQALVAAVLVVDGAEALPFSLAELLGDKREELVLLAPTNTAFEKLLNLDAGTLDGMSIDDIQRELPSLLPPGLGVEDVAAVLLKHAALPRKANRFTASERALLAKGELEVADESVFPVSVGNAGIRINYETSIIEPNVFVRNGVIHFIDTVITDSED
jgi:uncharacterized surface protein with fasciclin (FAS1) repeats